MRKDSLLVGCTNLMEITCLVCNAMTSDKGTHELAHIYICMWEPFCYVRSLDPSPLPTVHSIAKNPYQS